MLVLQLLACCVKIVAWRVEQRVLLWLAWCMACACLVIWLLRVCWSAHGLIPPLLPHPRCVGSAGWVIATVESTRLKFQHPSKTARGWNPLAADVLGIACRLEVLNHPVYRAS
ncbi:uncharacterized protein CYBJADRAFT_19807 [Cyberlindnera jadinii NRRL Y-1542]|uniref:Uncharacterized protein n=1 Tax=Cyberlindnera jadinii (strain ATCC 18201 / CBS 1600 / BCRC 20928 / JCM 3617 / NBRC 0987 / NRRL Y-1542) TaxID=983966 RepID=A0A1E4RYH7_CYBJN|nr:hypothetical protein CYBJADRAFT_19807 [Cyberlindnera jadinii NRRL Y-1542]ODV72342.1 hypothetical protein CYBJADRAFT_19807 [Cyberlindnera jadinii NRRL Y-1542]